jgi:antitoxin HigA-1
MPNQPHPGRIIRPDCLELPGLSIGEAAEALGVPRPPRERARRHLPEMASRLAKAFGSTPKIRMRLQASFDLAEAGKHKAAAFAAIRRIGRLNEPVNSLLKTPKWPSARPCRRRVNRQQTRAAL